MFSPWTKVFAISVPGECAEVGLSVRGWPNWVQCLLLRILWVENTFIMKAEITFASILTHNLSPSEIKWSNKCSLTDRDYAWGDLLLSQPSTDLLAPTGALYAMANYYCYWLREAPLKKLQGLFGHCPNGGGLNACQDGLGNLFIEELSMFKGAFACFGGSEPLPGWLGVLMQWKLKFEWHLLKSARK